MSYVYRARHDGTSFTHLTIPIYDQKTHNLSDVSQSALPGNGPKMSPRGRPLPARSQPTFRQA